VHPVRCLWSEEQAAEQVLREHRGQAYFTGCAGECGGQNVQSFVAEVEGTAVEVTSFLSSELSRGGFMAAELKTPVIGEKVSLRSASADGNREHVPSRSNV